MAALPIQTIYTGCRAVVSQFAPRRPLVEWMGRSCAPIRSTNGVTMSALSLGTRIARCAGLGLMVVGCGSAPAEETQGGAGSNVLVVDNFPGAAGQRSGNGFKGWRNPTAAGSGGAAAGTGGTAGSAGAAGEAPAAGSGGSAGSAGAAGGSAGGPAAGSGTTAPPEDPFDIFGEGSAGAAAEDPFDLFGMPGAVSCAGLLCAELADCQNLYPTEHAACKFTQCVDLECK